MRLLPGLLTVLLLASSVGATDWPQFHADPLHSGTAAASFTAPKELWWRQATGGPIEGSPVVSDGRVFIGSTDGKLYAYDAVTGTPLWNFTAGSAITSTPALSGGVLYLVTDAGNLYALDVATGEKRLSAGDATPQPGPSRASPSIHEGRIYVPTEAGSVIAYSLQTLTKDWEYLITEEKQAQNPVWDNTTHTYTGATCTPLFAAKPIRSSPAVYQNTVFFGSDVHALFAVDEFGLGGADAGKTQRVWEASSGLGCPLHFPVSTMPALSRHPMLEDVIRASPAIDALNDLVIVPSYDNTIRGFQVGDGAQLWNFTVALSGRDSRVVSTPAVVDGKVYFGSFNGKFYALQTIAQDPYVRELWNFTAGDAVWSSPAVANGLVAFGADDETLYVLDANNGQQVWRSRVGGDIRSSPAISGTVVYVGSSDGYLYAFGGDKPPRQDLMVKSIKYPADPLPANETVNVTIELLNAGNADAPVVDVELYINDTLASRQAIPALKAGQNTTLLVPWMVGMGKHTLRAFVDPAGISLEFDYANNVLSVTTPVAQEPPPPPPPPAPPTPPPTTTPPTGANGKPSTSTGKKTPGLELLGVLAALGAAAVVVQRRRRS